MKSEGPIIEPGGMPVVMDYDQTIPSTLACELFTYWPHYCNSSQGSHAP